MNDPLIASGKLQSKNMAKDNSIEASSEDSDSPGNPILENTDDSSGDNSGGWLHNLFGFGKNALSARDTLDELIDERDDAEVPINEEERILLSNILELRDRNIHDVMVPRADIIAISDDTPLAEIINIITQHGHSRLPLYTEDLDTAIGVIHAKDILSWQGSGKSVTPSEIKREVMFVSPAMRVLELLLEMRVKRMHMALVVDEYGGVDGLVTIEDLVEEIVGEIEDEHDHNDEPLFTHLTSTTFLADARVTLDTLEEEIGIIFSEDDREDIETLGGLVFSITGRVPVRGELITHDSGLEIEIHDADPRRIKHLKLRYEIEANS